MSAFKKLGLDCANWTEPVYLDLLRYEIRVLSNFFENALLFFFLEVIYFSLQLEHPKVEMRTCLSILGAICDFLSVTTLLVKVWA